jgi:hypothetical protein
VSGTGLFSADLILYSCCATGAEARSGEQPAHLTRLLVAITFTTSDLLRSQPPVTHTPRTFRLMSATDLFWDANLQQEKIRVLCESKSRDFPVSDILLDHSSDEDVPIVATLELEAKKKQKKQKVVVKEKRWEYVTVAEPTGIASKY